MEGTEGALLDESTTNIGIEEGVSLDNFSGVDSVVVEAPLGHGVTQWFSENYEGPLPEGPSDVPEPADATGSHPSNEYMTLEADFAADEAYYGKKLTKKQKHLRRTKKSTELSMLKDLSTCSKHKLLSMSINCSLIPTTYKL